MNGNETFAAWAIIIILATLLVESAIQDRVQYRDVSWWAWLCRHQRQHAEKRRLRKAEELKQSPLKK